MALTKITRAKDTGPRKHRTRAAVPRKRTVIPDVIPIGCAQPVSQTLPASVRRIVETLHPERIILFGSFAYGQPTPDSDVDLLVVMNTKRSRTERYLAVSQLLVPRPFAVDILVFTPQEIKSALAKGDFFIAEILEQGKVLYERG